MKRISWLLIIVFLLTMVMPGVNLSGNLAMAADTLRVAKITAVQGDVKVLRAGGEKTFPAIKGMGLTQGDTIITGKDGRATLELAADKELKIGENSRVKISELVQSQETNADKTSLNLKAGQVYTNVKGKLSPGAKYEIRTPTAVMGVRGTQFFVSLSSGGQAQVVTIEGNVFVTVPQVVTLEDGTTVTREIVIEVQANQVFVQTGDEELSLFVLETLQEISEQQPDLINPEILQNLEERIEQAQQKQQEQQQQIERQQQQLQTNIQYDNNAGSDTGTRTGSDSSSGSGSGGDSPTPTDPGDNDLPQVLITTQLRNIVLQAGEAEMCFIETEPDEDVELAVEVEDESVAEAAFEVNCLYIFGLQEGTTTVTVTAYKDGYLPAVASFTVTVYEEYQGGDWDRTIIDTYDEISHTDIAVDSRGMPHIIYDTYAMQYRHWNGGTWQDEEPQVGSRQGSITIVNIDGTDNSCISYNFYGQFGYDVFNGMYWSHQGFGDEGVTVESSSINTIEYDANKYGIGVSYYDKAKGDLYFRSNKYPTSYVEWNEPILVDGADSDVGKSSSLVFGPDGKAYIAYYDNSNGGSLKLAVIPDPLSPNKDDIKIFHIDDNLGYGEEGQYVSLAVDEEGILHLAYYDSLGKELRYKMFGFEISGGEWEIDLRQESVVDSGEDVGKYASLALDSWGWPHISYYAGDGSVGSLKHARFVVDEDDEYWVKEVIDQGPGVGIHSSMVIDQYSDTPHFVYTARIGDYWVVKHAARKGVMNTIEPNVLSGAEQAFGDETFYIESFGNKVSDVWRETGEDVEILDINEDYILYEDQGGLVFTLKSDFLNSLPVTDDGPHRVWITFDYGLPVFIDIYIDIPETAGYIKGSIVLPEGNAFVDYLADKSGKALAFAIDSIFELRTCPIYGADENDFLNYLNDYLSDEEGPIAIAEITPERKLKITSTKVGPNSRVQPLKLANEAIFGSVTEPTITLTSIEPFDELISLFSEQAMAIQIGQIGGNGEFGYVTAYIYETSEVDSFVANLSYALSGFAEASLDADKKLVITALDSDKPIFAPADAWDDFIGAEPEIVQGTGIEY